MDTSTIVSVAWGRLAGQRPRKAGSNARLGEHGSSVSVSLARITTEEGASGFGVCRAGRERATALIGQPLTALFTPQEGVSAAWLDFEYPLWDLAGKRAGKPVYRLAAERAETTVPTPFRVPCYDTSLYIDDLHLSSHEEATALIAAEANEGFARGHRAFKIKVGRGARHLPLDAGTVRDIAVIQAVRAAVGPQATLLLDANNGWNLNLTKRVLEETADCGVFWIEEAFHEDPVLYRDLRAWLQERNLPVLIADGEGQASPSLLDWAREGVLDVIQYDIFGHGFTRWLETGAQLDVWDVRSAPHHYGGHLGNYVSCHLASALRHFAYVEWDEATTPGLEAPGYRVEEGYVSVPETPGFGLSLDEKVFAEAVKENGWTVRLDKYTSA